MLGPVPRLSLCSCPVTPPLPQQVIKVGTSSLVRPEQQTLNLTNLARITETIKQLKSDGACVAGAGLAATRCKRDAVICSEATRQQQRQQRRSSQPSALLVPLAS